MFLYNRHRKRNLVWSISLPVHNKLHSKIVKHVLSLQYSNVNYASFMYCCAANKYEYLIFRIIIHVFIHETFTILVNVSLFQKLFTSKCTNNTIYELPYIRRKYL